MVHFRQDQPLFYRLNKKLNIVILAWDERCCRVVSISPDEVYTKKRLTIKVEDLMMQVYPKALFKRMELK